MTTLTTVTSKQASNYREAYDAFVAWHPKTLKRKGANGMVFDYLPVQNYEHFLDETVGPENWENDVQVGAKGVSVSLIIFGKKRASSSDIQTGGKSQNEVNKAEARAFRRAAAKHGLLRYLWEMDRETEEEDEDEDGRSARKSSFSKSSLSSKSSGKSSGSGSGKASDGQIKYLNDAFGVPKGVAAKLTGGRDGSASALIDALREAKGEDDYEDDPTPYIKKALKKIAPKLVSALEEGDEDEEDEDED